MKFQIPLFPHPLADFFCSRVIFWDKISYFKRGKGADVLENYALEPKMVQMTQEFRMWGMASTLLYYISQVIWVSKYSTGW